jgi:hypothetical protein
MEQSVVTVWADRRGAVGRLGLWVRIAGLAACMVSSGSCNALVREGRAASFLTIDRLEGASGGEDSPTFDQVLKSDVLTKGGVFEDPGRVTFRLNMKDPGSAGNPTAPTSANWITVTRYRVVFTRADGRNTPGVDVPYPFDGAITVTVTGGGTVQASFTLVRVQAKLEPPLMALRGLGGAVVIDTIAEVTFYGRDQTGAAVSVTGKISVNFADWADPS